MHKNNVQVISLSNQIWSFLSIEFAYGMFFHNMTWTWITHRQTDKSANEQKILVKDIGLWLINIYAV